MPQDTIYSPEAPTVAGNKLTVDLLLQQPLRLQKRLSTISLERMVANYIFAQGAPATGGAVIFDRVLANDLYASRDVQQIEPMAEFPLLSDDESAPLVSQTAKRGGAFEVSYEEKRRNQVDVVNRKLTRLGNTISRKMDTVAMAVLDADPVIAANARVAAATWANASTGNPINDIVGAAAWIENTDLGYQADTVLINPASEVDLMNNAAIRGALPREATATNPLLSGRINGLLNLNWIATNRVAKGTAYILQAKAPGSIHDEVPMYTRVTDQPRNESYLLQAARVAVPVITDPFSVVKLTGI